MLRQNLRSMLHSLRRPVRRPPPVERSTALEDELQFWREWFQTGGLEWPWEFRDRLDPQLPIQPYVATYIDRLNAERVRILDVGAGPLTTLGKRHPSKQLEIVATDLLAPEYDRLFAELGVEPPLRTVHADADRLVEKFGPDAFDVVHGQNCIDHTIDPLRAIEQMVAVSRPGGYVVLYHAENEGQRERYQQLHQWDFTCQDGSFVIGDRNGRVTDVTRRLAATCDVECLRLDGDTDSRAEDAARLAGLKQPGYEVAILVGIRKRPPEAAY
jgi:SAM-dependent methyltransferase